MVELRIEEISIVPATVLMHGHLICLPGLSAHVLCSIAPQAALPSVKIALQLLQAPVLVRCHQKLLDVHTWWHHVKVWLSGVVLRGAAMHTWRRLVSIVVHKLGLLVVAS